MEAARPKQYVCSGALHICRRGQQQDTVKGSQGAQPTVCSGPATCHKQKDRAHTAGHVIHPGSSEGMTACVPIESLEEAAAV